MRQDGLSTVPTDDPRGSAEHALQRLMSTNRPGRLSLAGAYAFGYGALGLAQTEGESPDWFDQIDPLDALFLGTTWPGRFRDAYEFGNARTAWLRLMRTTGHWTGIERFVPEVVQASEQHELPVDEGELMLLVAGRLEDAELDLRPLPASLLPKTALADARFIAGPPADLHLPDPPPDARDRAQSLWASTEVDLAHDGTALDALREGLHLLSQAHLPVREHSLMLLVALYAALVADENELINEDTADRAHAWALGLPDDSPLTPIVDVLVIAAQRDLSADQALGHLLALDGLDNPVQTSDRRWRSAPGTQLADIAFELGFTRLSTRAHDLVKLTPAAVDAMQAQYRRFEEKFGRPPGPHDPVFFDPDRDEPTELSVAEAERSSTAMLQAAGIHPAWIYATQNTGGLMPQPDGTFADARRDQEWNQALTRFLRTHPRAEPFDRGAELAKYRTVLAVLSVGSAAEDPQHASELVRRLGHDAGQDEEVDLLAKLLAGMAPDLLESLRTDEEVRMRATENARAWSGAELASRVLQYTHSTHDINTPQDLPVLLATLAARLPNSSDGHEKS